MKYFINGQKFDTEKAQKIYSDGQFSNTGEDYYKTKGGKYIVVEWSRWQGSSDTVTVLSEDQFVKAMKESWHEERALEALKLAGFTEQQINELIPDFA